MVTSSIISTLSVKGHTWLMLTRNREYQSCREFYISMDAVAERTDEQR